MRMVELLGSGNKTGLTYGAAMEQAIAELGLPKPPVVVAAALLSAALKIIGSGRVPGCPDA